MKEKIKPKVIHVPIYDGKLYVYRATNKKQLKRLCKKYSLSYEDALQCRAFVFIPRGSCSTWCAIFRDDDIPYIIHECVHLSNMIFKDRGITPDLDNDEPQAYLLEFLFKKVKNCLKKK